jgi:tRNA-specific 2-thiouridylase
MFHTMGQRKGLHIGGIKEKARRVAAITTPGSSPARTWKRTCCTSSRGTITRPCSRAIWWPSSCPGCHRRAPHAALGLHRQAALPDKPTSPAKSNVSIAKAAKSDFAEPQWALTPGQSVVLYESRVCLGGGIIR